MRRRRATSISSAAGCLGSPADIALAAIYPTANESPGQPANASLSTAITDTVRTEKISIMAANTEMSAGQVVQNYLDTFFKKDVEKTLECLTDDMLWKVQGAPEVPTIGFRQGKDQVCEWMALFPVNSSLLSSTSNECSKVEIRWSSPATQTSHPQREQRMQKRFCGYLFGARRKAQRLQVHRGFIRTLAFLPAGLIISSEPRLPGGMPRLASYTAGNSLIAHPSYAPA